ncbi:MAG: hypothetical protein JW750_06525 [Anaerolineaceae bacterium]|nr:hypothetical protein [Anaerolineaceae bacterium]
MNIGEVFRKSWDIVWKHKILWFFGFLVSLANGGGSGNSGSNLGDKVNYQFSAEEFPYQMHQLENWFEQNVMVWSGLLVLLVIVLIVIALFFAFLSIVGRGALIKGAWMADEDENAVLKLGGLFRLGMKYFWKLFLLGLLFFAAIIGLLIVLVLFSVITLGLGLIALCCLWIPLIAAMSLLHKQSAIAIVGEDMGVMDSIGHAWKIVFKENLAGYLIMTLIVGIGGTLARLLLALPIMLIVIPLVIGLVAESQIITTGGIVFMIIFVLLYLPVLVVLSGGLNAYLETVWTLYYRRVTKKTADEEIIEISPAPAPDPEADLPMDELDLE